MAEIRAYTAAISAASMPARVSAMSDRWQPGVQAIASQRGEIVKILADEFKSGKDTNRPAFQELLTELEIGHAEWDCVCVYKLSRITRSLRDGANIFEKFIQ